MSGPDDVPGDPRLEEIALHLVDDEPVDWEGARQTHGDLSETLERLRQLEALSQRAREQAAPPAAEAPGLFSWGPLRVLERLGEGGFGEVYRAWDPALAREVALKLRRADAAGGAARWLREAQALARVRHPHVVTIFGADTHAGRTGIWMERIPGRTLEQLLLELGPLGAREAAGIGADLCAALASVHRAGLVHGDVKTRNVMREGEPRAAEGAGRVVLMDFGTAHEREGAGASSGGTPLFAAPELLAGGAPSPASDLYALGVVLYRLVTGRFPIEAASLAELRDRHARRALEPLRALRPDLPAPFVQAVERALAPEPRQRFRDAAEMEHALAATLGGARGAVEVRASWRRVLAGAAAGALLVALAWAGVRWVPEWTRPRLRVAPAGPARATRVLQTLVGDEVAGHFGFAVANVGDVDGDGIPELLVGALDEANDSGRVHLYKGMPDGSYRPWRTFETGALCVAALGDVNHDGIPDFAVGNPNDDAHGKRVGVVHVYFGDRRLGGVHAADLYPPRGGTLFGYSVAGAGDVNGDGYADIVVGAPNDAGDGRAAGIAYVYYGGARIGPGPNLTLRPHSIAGQFGIAVAGIGDFNGDGFADFAVGANVDRKSGAGTGRVAIYYGGRAPAAEPALDLYGPHDNTWFGIALAGLGDVDGDGFDDLAVGAERGDGFEPLAGSVSVFRGGQHPAPLPWKVLRGPAAHSMFGHALAAGDVLGDGRPNLVVGGFYVPDEGFAAGATYVYDLLRKGDSPELELTGTDDHGNLGTSVAVVPARPGAHAGVIAGAPYSGTSEGGAVWVFGISRHAFTRPHAGERWTAGASERVAWLGAARADLEWSPAGREAWQPLAAGVGGRDQNTAAITVPRAAGPIVLRLRPAGPHAAAATLSDTVFVDAAR